MAWEENPRICLHMQLIAILSRTGVKFYDCEINAKLHIDLVILSHPDLDHVSGLVEMAKDEDVEIRHILMHSLGKNFLRCGLRMVELPKTH